MIARKLPVRCIRAFRDFSSSSSLSLLCLCVPVPHADTRPLPRSLCRTPKKRLHATKSLPPYALHSWRSAPVPAVPIRVTTNLNARRPSGLESSRGAGRRQSSRMQRYVVLGQVVVEDSDEERLRYLKIPEA